jgi:hypothetical protein
MRNILKVGLVILLLLSVIAVFISPAADLAPTAMRAVKLANLLFSVLALAGIAVIAHVHRHDVAVSDTCEVDYILRSAPDLVVLNCTLLC